MNNDSHDLESIYIKARQALKAKNFDRASDLLRQILLIDENYKDVSHLLAQSVKLKRRRWYNDMRPRAMIGFVVIGLLIWLVPKVLMPAQFAPRPTAATSPTMTVTPTKSPIPTVTASPASTPIPLAWKRVYIGNEFPHDTVNAIIGDNRDPDVIYAGLENAGVYKSIDGGNSWFPAQTGLGSASIASLAIDPQNPQIVYTVVKSSGVYKTNDGGEHWQSTNNGIQNLSTFQTGIAMSPLDPKVLYYWAFNYIYKTTDGGVSWKLIKDSACPQNILNLALHPTDSQILFAQDLGYSEPDCKGGVYKSTDGGKTWAITELSLYMGGSGPDLLIDNQQGLYLYAAVQPEGDNEATELYGSIDGGNTWKRLHESRGFGSLKTCKVHSENAKLVLCGAANGALYKTTNGGQSWQTLPALDEDVANAIYFLPQPEGGILIGGKGMYRSENGVDLWMEINNGLGGGILELFLDPTSKSGLYLEGKTSDLMWSNAPLYHSADAGQSWELMIEQGHGLTIDANKKTLYRLDLWDSPLRSQDYGHTWTKIRAPYVRTLPNEHSFLVGLAAHPSEPGKLYAANEESAESGMSSIPHLFASLNGGGTWQESVFPYPDFALIRTGKFIFGPGQEIYLLPYNNKLFQSPDNGQTWSACGWENNAAFRDMDIDPINKDHLFLATRGEGIQISNDGCATWRSSNIGLNSLFVNTIAIDPNNPDLIYAGTDGGAHVSFNGGQTWDEISDGRPWGEINEGLLGALVIYSIVIDEQSNVYAATPYGIFMLENK